MTDNRRMAEWILGNLTDAERSNLARLACARYFDRQVFAAVNPPASELTYEHITRLPIVQRYRSDTDAYELIGGLGPSLIASLTDQQHRDVSASLYQLYRDSDDIEALYHLFVADAGSADQRLHALFQEADEQFDLPRCHLLLQVAMERQAYVTSAMRKRFRSLLRRLETRRLWAEERYSTVFYVERADVESALRDLLDNHSDTWILHVHAPGGRGKTMFIDAAISRMCAPDIPCAKIDFDYVIHTVAVSREPWRLIIRIAEQLAVQLEDRALADLVDEYRDLVASDFSLAALPRGRGVPGQPTRERSSLTDELTTRFASIVTDRMGSDPVLLVFDTLENALHSPGTDIGRIAETLARIRELVTGLRVILAGRFNLANRVMSMTMTLASEARVVEIPPFSPAEAETYLRVQRRIDRADLIEAIAEKANGNPLKLALLADEAAVDPALDAASVLAFPRADLFYLVDRVIDRIEDRRVRWLVRWGVLPPRLEQEFFQGVLWPLLAEQLSGRNVIDVLDNDPQLLRERGAFTLADQDIGNPDALWQHLEQYVSAASWVSRAGHGERAVVFHPDVRQPMREILREHQPTVWSHVHQQACTWWSKRAYAAGPHRDERLSSVRAAMFHALRQTEQGDDSALATWGALTTEYAGDYELAAELAREVLDAQRELTDAGHSPVAPELRAAAYLALAADLLKEEPGVARQHVASADALISGESPVALRAQHSVIRGAVQVALGEVRPAETLLHDALTMPGIRPVDQLLAQQSLGVLFDERDPTHSLRHRHRAWQLARDQVPALAPTARAEFWQYALHCERYDLLEPLSSHEKLQYLLAVGRIDGAAEVLHQLPADERDATMHAWVHLEQGEPMEASAALGAAADMLNAATSADHLSAWAIARAQLCDLEQALLHGDLVARRLVNGRAVWQLAIALARACAQHGAFRTAERLLASLSEPAPSWDLWIARDLMRIGVLHGQKRVDDARPLWTRTVDDIRAESAPALTPSVRVFATVVGILMGDDADAAIARVCDVLAEVQPASRRLRLLDGFRAVAFPELAAHTRDRLYDLVAPAHADTDLGAIQQIRWAVLLRLAGRRSQAKAHLCQLLARADGPVARLAWSELDQLGELPDEARPVALDRYQSEPAFVGVVSLERAERLFRYDRENPEMDHLLDVCNRTLPGTAVAPWRIRFGRIRKQQWQVQSIENSGNLIDENRGSVPPRRSPQLSPSKQAPPLPLIPLSAPANPPAASPAAPPPPPAPAPKAITRRSLLDVASYSLSAESEQTAAVDDEDLHAAGEDASEDASDERDRRSDAAMEPLKPQSRRRRQRRPHPDEPHTVGIQWESPTAWRVTTAAGDTLVHRLDGALASLRQGRTDALFPADFTRTLPAHWREVAHELGPLLALWGEIDIPATRDSEPGDTHLFVNAPNAPWVPFELASVDEQVIARSVCMLRHSRRSPALPAAARARLWLVDERGHGLEDSGPDSWHACYRRADLLPEVISPQHAAYGLARDVDGPSIIHLSGALHTYRNRVYLHMHEHAGTSGQAVAVHPQQLARALAGASHFLVVLSIRRPSSPAEQARQLILRNVFANQLVSAHPGGAVLGIGLAEPEHEGIVVRTVVDHLVREESLGTMIHALHEWAATDLWRITASSRAMAPEQISSLVEQATQAGLLRQRARLLRGMPRAAVRELPLVTHDPSAQLASDLANLGRLADDGHQHGLQQWIENAVEVTHIAEDSSPDALGKLRTELQGLLASRAQSGPGSPAAPPEQDEREASRYMTAVCAFEQILPFAGSVLFCNHPEISLPIAPSNRQPGDSAQ